MSLPAGLELVVPEFVASKLEVHVGRNRARAVFGGLRDVDEPPMWLACLVTAAGPAVVAETLDRSKRRPHAVIDAEGLAEWLSRVSVALVDGRAAATGATKATAAHVAGSTPRAPGAVVWPAHRAMRALPLRPLAEDVAGRLGGLVVAVGALDDLVRGVYMPPGVIVVARHLLDDPDALAAVWAHELAHAVDDAAGLSRLEDDQYRAEAIADALGPLLLEHEPATLDAAVELLDATVGDTLPAPARHGRDDLMAAAVSYWFWVTPPQFGEAA